MYLRISLALSYALKPFPGKSLVRAAQGGKTQDRVLYFEHQGSCAIIDGHWKLVRDNRRAAWELIDLEKDPFEIHNLAEGYPEKVQQLEAKWNAWAEANHVLPLEDMPWGKRIDYYNGQ